MTAKGGEVRAGDIEKNGKKTQGHGQQYGDFQGEEGKGDYLVMEKNTIKIKLK